MKSKAKTESLQVVEASENNLKNVSVSIPHNSLTVITGVSGSGKSSLAYDVIFKESQRRFLESFSSFSRQYLGKLEKPGVKNISGLQAALAINQKTAVANPRSTVGTMSGIYDYLRLLFARTGIVHCVHCHQIIKNRKTDHCDNCGTAYPEIQAKLFSFNATYGACPHCKGLGITEQIDPEKLIADPNKTLREGALVPTTPNGYIVYSQVRVDELDKICRAHGFSVDIPWTELTEEQQKVVMYGSDRIKILFGKHSLESRLKWKGITAKPREEAYYKGMIPIMEEILHRDRNDNILRFASTFTCNVCRGNRLRPEALSVFIDGKNISELSNIPLSELYAFLKNLTLTIPDQEVTDHILHHAIKRLDYLQLLGLEYLSLSRASTTLSGGEAQRIRLAAQVGSGLQGILYILDEPSIGLHPRDNKRLLKVLRSLRDNGNTLLVVEHDEETIKSADYLIDIGPKAGKQGGELIYQGDTFSLLSNKHKFQRSITAATISASEDGHAPKSLRRDKGVLSIRGASKYNLKNIDIDFRLHAFNVVTGVSGAGKSTLVHQVLVPSLKNNDANRHCKSIESSTSISRIIEIDQSPIGRTPRSNPATYTDLFDHIRDIFGNLPESKKRGYKKGRFSFNNKGGRCEKCQGAGSIQLGMHFLGDVEIVCETCNGKRFNDETLDIRYQGKNIYDVLELSVEEAIPFFEGEEKVIRILDQLNSLDVGYLKLGQPSTTLSGGEAQRVKLASELYKTSKGHNLYILDEPSVGLHKADISYLMDALNAIVDNGNTVIVIEHDTDIIQQADHIIDLGPEGGQKGGYLVAIGNLNDIVNCEQSHTGKALETIRHPHKLISDVKIKRSKAADMVFKGISTNNLKNIDVSIPLNKITVVTGVSGSGKSSLAFDTIYAESRNRFTESLSSYARRMMSKVKKAELEQCSGLTPAIAIRQSPFRKNPRSTVGTATEIFDHYRLLFSRAGKLADGSFTTLPASQFSFNNIDSACPTCKGLGIMITTTPEQFISHPEKPLIDGALQGSLPGNYFGDPYGQFVNTLIEVGRQKNIDFGIPYEQLSETAKKIALHGTGEAVYEVSWHFKRGNRTGTHKMKTTWKGFVNYINEEYEIKRGGKRGEAYELIMSEISCPECHGKRFRKEILDVHFDKMDIAGLSSMSIQAALAYFRHVHLENDILERSHSMIDQIISKLTTLDNIGLGYISIDRPTATLSGGEAQRLRIATQLVADLCGLTYVLDEPTTGLHPHDTRNLMKAIQQLKELGNTVVIVEHDPDIMLQANHIIDVGPGAGTHGGLIVGQGHISDILKQPHSITGKYLKAHTIKVKNKFRPLSKGIQISGASAHNLKNIDINIPSGGLVAITGLSGSGKTSLAFDVIAKSFKAGKALNCREISFENMDHLLVVDQQKIGTSPLSTPATYTGVFDLIRELYAATPEAKTKKLKKSHFSFNSKNGRCDTCKGMGLVKVPMDFLSDVWVSCDACHGKRYKDPVLEVRYKESSISHVLDMEVSEAIRFFGDQPKICHILQVLEDIGLGYATLGQATSTLSGGETQRLKLASHLIKEQPGRALFIFDEPTTGLHMQDVEKLLQVFRKLVDAGHSLIVVEHNLDIIRASDWVIDLGPEGGDKGGELVFAGQPSDIIDCKESSTGEALRNFNKLLYA